MEQAKKDKMTITLFGFVFFLIVTPTVFDGYLLGAINFFSGALYIVMILRQSEKGQVLKLLNL